MAYAEPLDIERVCRVCMRSDQDMLLIFDEKYADACTKTNIAAMLTECTMYKVERFDKLPHLICASCLDAATSAFRFKRKCEQSHRKLLDLLGTAVAGGRSQIKMEILEREEKSTQTEDTTMYPCERCAEKFFTFEALRAHRETEHKGSAIVCRFCGKSFNRVGYLKTHIAVFHPESGYTSHNQCHICKRQFTRREHMRRHLAVIHKIVEIADDLPETEESAVESERAEVISEIDCTPDKPCARMTDEHVQVVLDTPLSLSEQLEFVDKRSVARGSENDEAPLNTDGFHVGSSGDGRPVTDPLPHQSARGFIEVLLNECVMDDDLGELPADSVDILKRECSPTPPEKHTTKAGCGRSSMRRTQRRAKRVLRNHSPPTTATASSSSADEASDEYKCDTCGEAFQQRTQFQLHMLQHNAAQQHPCKICSKRFSDEDELKRHMSSAHDASRLQKCDECDKQFTHITQYKRHKQTKHSKKLHKCDTCQKSFTTRIYLQRHMTIHEKKRYVCKECSQSYVTKDELNEHIKAEGHDKPMLCPECGLRCKTSNILMVHMRRHNGEKPFKCKFCSKGFPRMDDLRVHEKYHTNEKSHFCETCGKGFQRKYNLTIHLRVHTGEKPYKCPHCTQAFAQGNDLKAHIRRHTGERFRCEVCGAAFLQGYQIRQHKLTEHGIKEVPPTQRVAKFTSPEEQEQQIKQNLQREHCEEDESIALVDTIVQPSGAMPMEAVLIATAEPILQESIVQQEFMNI